jgi:4-amino-4-deoxy-L-arabinose transferase-like glycosyltransferase
MTIIFFLKNNKSQLKAWLIIFSFGLFLRLLMIMLYPNMPVPPDTIFGYDPIANNLLAGNGFVQSIGHPDFIRGPGYPLFLSAVYLFFGHSYIFVRIIQSILDSLTLILTMLLCWLLFKNWPRTYFTGIIFSIYPLLIYSSNLVGVETLFCFCFILSVFNYILAVKTEKIVLFLISGIVLAFTSMVRSTPLLFPIIMGIWLFFSTDFDKKYIYYFVLFCCGFILTLTPWTIRNYLVFHEFIPTVANGGNNFQAGSSLKYLVPLKERMQVKNQESKEPVRQKLLSKQIIFPQKWDTQMWHIGWQNYIHAWERNHFEVAKLLLYKTARFWFATDSGKYQRIIFFIQIPFLILAITGLAFIIKEHCYVNELWLMVLSIAYFWAVFIVMFPLARYSVPLLPFLSIFVSGLFKNRSLKTYGKSLSKNKACIESS